MFNRNHNPSADMVIRSLSNLIRRHVDNSGVRAEMESVTGTNGWVIIYLSHHPDDDVYQRDLEQIFSVRRSTMSNILALMEKKELIRRESVSHDARLKKLILTEKAQNLCRSMEADRANTEAIITEGITPEEMEVFFDITRRMRENLERADGPCEPPKHRHGPKYRPRKPKEQSGKDGAAETDTESTEDNDK